jgi:rhodanese-related sulfurtransferase
MSRKVSPLQLQELLQGSSQIQLIDVRSPAEFASGHVPGAVNIPMEQVESRLSDVAREGEVVLICEAGKRASITAEWLCERRDVTVLEGGTKAWRDANLPVVTCVACRWSLERQVRLAAGILILIGGLLAFTVSVNWLWLTLLVGGGLTMAGLTNFCPMAIFLSKLPWNKASAKKLPGKAQAGSCCS